MSNPRRTKPYVKFSSISYYGDDGEFTCSSDPNKFSLPVYSRPNMNCDKRPDFSFPVFDNKFYTCNSDWRQINPDYTTCATREECSYPKTNKLIEEFTTQIPTNQYSCPTSGLQYKSINDMKLPSDLFQVSPSKTCGLYPFVYSEKCDMLEKEGKLRKCGSYMYDNTISEKMYTGGPRPRFIYSSESNGCWQNENCKPGIPSDIDSY